MYTYESFVATRQLIGGCMRSCATTETSALVEAVIAMNYERIQEVTAIKKVPHDDTWLDYLCLLFALNPSNLSDCNESEQSNTVNIIKLLIESGCRVTGAKNNDYCTPLFYAVHSLDRNTTSAMKIIKMLLQAGASLMEKSSSRETPLQRALKNHKMQAVDLMLSNYNILDINVQDKDHMAHFVIACIRNQSTLVDEFIKRGMWINRIVDSLNFNDYNWPNYSTYMHVAVWSKSWLVVQVLLQHGAAFTLQDENYHSPLHVAYNLNEELKKKECSHGVANTGIYKRIIDSILSVHVTTTANPYDKQGLSHLHIACAEGNRLAVDHLLRYGLYMKRDVTETCDTFLNMAAKNGQEEIIKTLVANKVDVNQKGAHGKTPLHLAMEMNHPNIFCKLLKLQASINITDNEGNTPIHTAFFSLPATQVMLYDTLKLYCKINLGNLCNKQGLSIFHIACAIGFKEIVQKLAESGVDVNACVNRDSNMFPGFTAMHFAAMNHHKHIIDLLLRYKAYVNPLNREGATPMMIAIESVPKYDLVYQIIEVQLKFEKERGVPEAKVDLNFLIDLTHRKLKNIDVIRFFIQKNDNVNCTDKKGNPLLFRALIKHATTLRTSREIVANTSNRRRNEMIRNMCNAFFDENLEKTMDLLIEFGVDVNTRDQEGNSIFHHINAQLNLHHGALSQKTAEKFFKMGAVADVQNKKGMLPINQIVQQADIKMLNLFLKNNVNINLADEKYGTPLHAAALFSSTDTDQTTAHYEIINLLLTSGVDINAKNKKGLTPIFEACKYTNSGKSLELLLRRGADVNATDNDGRTALFTAVIHSNARCTQLLLDHGVDIQLKDKHGMTVLKKIFTYHTVNNIHERKFLSVVTIMGTHLKRLQALRILVNRKDLLNCKRLKYAYYRDRYPAKLTNYFTKEYPLSIDNCKEDRKVTTDLNNEVQSMKNVKVNKYTTLFDTFFKDSDAMKRHIENEDFNKMMNDEFLFQKYPYFGSMLRSKFHRDSIRSGLLSCVASSSNVWTKKKLSELCLSKIFAYLSNEDLKNLMKI